MDKKKLAGITFMLVAIVSSAFAALPPELSCTSFTNSSVQFCDTLDQIGTGIGVMSYKVNLGLPTLLIGLAIVAAIILLLAAFAYLIKNALERTSMGGHGKGRF